VAQVVECLFCKFKTQSHQKKKKEKENQPNVVVHTCTLSTGEAEAEKFQVQGQPGLLSKMLFQKKKVQNSNMT
jgi:Flp pilus assembly protein CpaB